MPVGRLCFVLLLLSLAAASSAELTVSFARTNGLIRPLHGGNNGPLGTGETVDLTPAFRELAIPFVRLHDSAWPYPDIVDIHALFPNPEADSEDPRSYRFGPTDDYLRAITNVGSRLVYRLGESIEHAKRKRYVHPPAQAEKWAQVCLGIIRHYNEGWAEGHRLGVEYWEIWNEPENRPAMWTGTPEQFYSLYSTAAKAIKARWPRLKVGGPALGHQGAFKNGRLVPSEFLQGFIDRVRRDNAPLDFFSWHGYTDDPWMYRERASAVRAYLDAEGFRQTESHLNEWNYLPDHDWGPVLGSPGPGREQWYARQGGIEGAAFLAAVLIDLQDAPLDVANYYGTDNQPFGLFSIHGAPKKTYFAFKAFRSLLNTPFRVNGGGSSAGDGRAWLAGMDADGKEGAILIALPRRAGDVESVRVEGGPWAASAKVEVHILDAGHDDKRLDLTWDPVRPVLRLDLKAPSVTTVRFRVPK